MTNVCDHCRRDDAHRAPFSKFCLACQRTERRLIDRSEREGWLGNDRVRAAVMHLRGGSGFYVLALHQFAMKTGWLPHHVQARPCCPKLIMDPRHRPDFGCWGRPGRWSSITRS